MAKQTINLGTGPNTGTGEPIRTAFGKVNDNFTEVYGIAQSAYDYANTIVSDTQIDPLARSTANSAYDQANTATTLAQASYDYANTIVSDTQVDPLARSTANSAFDGANSASQLAQSAYDYANTIASADTGNISFTDTTISPPDGQDLILSAANSVVDIQSSDFRVETTDDVRITSSNVFSLRNKSSTEPIQIITDYDGSAYAWVFDVNGNMTVPGDITVSGDVTGTIGSSTLYIKAQPEGNTYIQLNENVDSTIGTSANLEIQTDVLGVQNTWKFGVDSTLYLPGNLSIDTACTSSQINFVANSSGDGNGYTTIEIIPDTNLTGTDQYLIIDPTDPTHIHIRAGGTQDDSGASLFLGGENSHFLVYSGLDPAVAITANNNTWYFSVDGEIQFPDSSSQTTAFTSNPTLDFTTTNVLKIEEGVQESYSNIANATGTIVHNCANGHIFYHTTPTSNWTANFTNLQLTEGCATSLTLVISQGATGYIANTVLIDSSSTTIKWQANTVPTPNVNSTDVLSFSVLKTGPNNGDVIVLGQLSTFG